MLRPFIFSILFLLTTWVDAQEPPLDIKGFSKNLATKQDPRSAKFNSVATTIRSLGASQQCEVISRLVDEGPQHSKRYSLQVLRLKCHLALNNTSCPNWPQVEYMFKAGWQLSYENDDPILIAEMNRLIMSYYTQRLDYGSARVYGLVAREMEMKAGAENFSGTALLRYFLGYVTFHSRDYRTSIETSKEAIYWTQQPGAEPMDTLDDMVKMNTWNTIGLCYEKLALYDSAFIAFNEALAISHRINNKFWTDLIKGNQGDVYYNLEEYDSAKILLSQDVETSFATQQWDNAANSKQWLARISLKKGKTNEALREARTADSLLALSPKPDYKANLLYTYTQVFMALDQADSMNIYMKKYLALHDSIEQEATDSRAEIVRMRMDNHEFVHRIVVLNKEKKKIALIRNLIILIILMAASTGYLLLHRQRLKLKWRQQQIIQEVQKAEKDAHLAMHQLEVFTEHLVEKTNLVEKLESQLLGYQITPNPENADADLTHIVLLTEEDWEKFKVLFEHVNPGFFDKLKDVAPDITIAEQRMAALIKLKIPGRKAASILAISPNSAYKSRQRLRHRLGLETDTDLDSFFSGDGLSPR